METTQSQDQLQQTTALSEEKNHLFDWLRSLEEDTDLQFIFDLTSHFEHHSEELLKGIQNDIEQKDYKAIAFKAHKLKSAAGNLGSTSAWKHCQQIEEYCQSEQIEQIVKIFPDLSQECAQTFLSCKEYIFLKEQQTKGILSSTNKSELL